MTINDFQKGSIVFSEYIFILKEKTNYSTFKMIVHRFFISYVSAHIDLSLSATGYEILSMHGATSKHINVLPTP